MTATHTKSGLPIVRERTVDKLVKDQTLSKIDRLKEILMSDADEHEPPKTHSMEIVERLRNDNPHLLRFIHAYANANTTAFMLKLSATGEIDQGSLAGHFIDIAVCVYDLMEQQEKEYMYET